LDRNCFANFDEPRQQLAIQPGETLTSGKTWKSSVNLPRSNLCTTELNNAAISAFLKSIAHQYRPATVKTAFVQSAS